MATQSCLTGSFFQAWLLKSFYGQFEVKVALTTQVEVHLHKLWSCSVCN